MSINRLFAAMVPGARSRVTEYTPKETLVLMPVHRCQQLSTIRAYRCHRSAEGRAPIALEPDMIGSVHTRGEDSDIVPYGRAESSLVDGAEWLPRDWVLAAGA